MLDFGCGPGRTLREFLPEAETAEVWGVDVDVEAVATVAREHAPPLHVARCDLDPPLDFEDGSLDLIWAISVFTHLTGNSLAWLRELHRVLKPDGILIATFMGRWHSELLLGEPWDEDRVGMMVLRHTSGKDEGTPMVLMSDWWVREHWGRVFDVEHIEPQVHNQSWAAMRRRDVELSVAELEAPGDDPREYVALRENLRQTQRELEGAQEQLARERADHAAALQAARAEYETSSSWRLTRPLREARRWLRER